MVSFLVDRGTLWCMIRAGLLRNGLSGSDLFTEVMMAQVLIHRPEDVDKLMGYLQVDTVKTEADLVNDSPVSGTISHGLRTGIMCMLKKLFTWQDQSGKQDARMHVAVLQMVLFLFFENRGVHMLEFQNY